MDDTLERILDRKHLRRRLTIWRVVAFLSIAAGIAIAAAGAVGLETSKKSSAHIARVEINGFISSNRYALAQLDKIREDENVKAVIVSVNSPGGTTVGGEELHYALRKIAEEKPVAANVGTLAASAGYMVAIGADHIVAPRTSIVGSIGVIMQYPNATELLNKLGVTFEEIKSSPLKAEPFFFNETPPEATVMLRSMLLDTYDWFANLVKNRRGFSDADAEGLLDGSVFSGQQALERKLVDALGGEPEAKKWLVEEKEIGEDLEIISWSLTKPKKPTLADLAGFKAALNALGLGQLVELSDQAIQSSRNSHLDGFLSVWQAGQ